MKNIKKGFIELSIIGIIALMITSFFVGNYFFNTKKENNNLGGATIVRVPQGGTGLGNITANTLLTGNGTGNLATTTIGSGLTLSGGTLTADAVTSDATFAWTPATTYGENTNSTTTPIWVQENIYASSTIYAPSFIAESTTATSTFAGGLAVETSGLVYDYSTNNVGVGTASPLAKLHTLSTTEQFRLGYDASNYWSGTVGSTGGLTLAGTGAGGALSLTPTSGQNLNVNLAGTGDLAVNTNQLYVDTSTGNVGIGTTSPLQKLQVAGGKIKIDYQQSINSSYSGVTDGGAGFPILGTVMPDNVFLRALSNGAHNGVRIEQYDSTLIAFFQQGGNVGIGTTGPGRLLELKPSSSDAYIQLTRPTAAEQSTLGFKTGATDDWLIRTLTNSDLNIYSFGTDTNVLTILKANGNVGIGTTAPTAVLHLKAGTATANTAPLKFTSGALNTTAEAGAVEFLTDAYYGTITTGAARKTFAFLESPSFTTPTLGDATGTSLQLSGLTASEILGTDASKNLVSLAVATYPSLTELSYVKGVSSAIQTQLNAKQGTLTNSAGLLAALSDETGTGLAVFNTSPTFTTPDLGTPSALTLTNATGLPAASVLAGSFGAGAYDFGGATSFELPNNGTVDANGEITTDDTSGQLRYYAGSAERVLIPNDFRVSGHATSTWSATTTQYIAPAGRAITAVTARCETDAGSVGVSLYDGTNRTDFFTASTTIGTITFTTNNTFTANESMRVDFGTPVSSPKQVACTFGLLNTAD